jgi:hypothetical protein
MAVPGNHRDINPMTKIQYAEDGRWHEEKNLF